MDKLVFTADLFKDIGLEVHKAFDGYQSLCVTLIDSSYLNHWLNLPKVEKAAELMGVTEQDVQNMLLSKGYELIDGDRLEYDAVEYLADKYVDNVSNYFNNYLKLKCLDEPCIEAFSTFCSSFSNSGNIVLSWDGIDVNKIRDAFIYELTKGTSLFDADRWFPVDKPGLGENMRRIVKSLLYHMKIKTRCFLGHGMGGFVISFIIANHFHIFTSESDSSNRANKAKGKSLINDSRKAKLTPVAA